MTRRAARPLAVAAMIVLAGCGHRDNDNVAADTASISFSGTDDDGNGASDKGGGNDQSVSLSVPGFSAKLSVPGLALGAHDTDIDGIRFRPGSHITGMNVTGKAGDGTGGEGNGTVEMHFSDPAAPDAVLAYYRDAAHGAGWTEVPPAAGEQFAATRHKTDGDERMGLTIGAAAQGSTGKFVVTGS